ncbi:MAG: alkaline phosphatase family protein, partial [Actinomycetota bacterium]
MLGKRRPPFVHPVRLGALVVIVALFAGTALMALRDKGAGNERGQSGSIDSAERVFSTADPVRRACGLKKKMLLRIWRGYYPGRSEDVVMVPQYPNYSGVFDLVNHSGPWDYLTNVPLVFYGPRRVAAEGRLEDEASITDVYATAGELTGVDLPKRDGRVLSDMLRPGVEGVPKLIVTLVWDGVGRNVLEEWPNAWPTLARLEREGTSFSNASVGSSPTITPAIHSSLGTGAWPRSHGVTGIYYQT